MRFFLRIVFFACVMFLSSCAASYKPINPPRIKFNTDTSQDGIGFSYKYDVLRERGNKKYAKKEDKKGLKLVAVKISNNTETTINVGRDIIFYSGTNQIIPMEPMHIKKEIKQIVPAYLPYLLLSFLTLNIQNGNTTEIYPIGIVIGPGITIRNMAVAGTANKKMFSELNDFNIINEEIQKGESKYGIIGIYESGFNPITVKLRK